MKQASSDLFKAACVQMCTGKDIDRNIEIASDLIRQAAAQGADFIVTPEQTALMELGSKALFANVVSEKDDRAIAAFSSLAQDLGVWLLIGSLAIKLSAEKVANRSYLISPKGRIHATYDKIHMFDVALPGGETYRESKNYKPGSDAVVADLPWGRLGMTVCYDLRFGGLYRTLAQSGADFLSIPSAFTQTTGQAHWHILMRARAIETGCYVVAAAQGGTHENGRETYGHSLIVSPWGDILAEADVDPGFIMADIDRAQVNEARGRIPSLQHDRAFTLRNATEGQLAS